MTENKMLMRKEYFIAHPKNDNRKRVPTECVCYKCGQKRPYSDVAPVGEGVYLCRKCV